MPHQYKQFKLGVKMVFLKPFYKLYYQSYLGEKDKSSEKLGCRVKQSPFR